MDAVVELGRNPANKRQIQPEYGDKQADAGRGCRGCRNKILRRERVQGNIHFACWADHEQDWYLYSGYPDFVSNIMYY